MNNYKYKYYHYLTNNLSMLMSFSPRIYPSINESVSLFSRLDTLPIIWIYLHSIYTVCYLFNLNSQYFYATVVAI